MFLYKEKYYKYKNKYLKLKRQFQLGGVNNEDIKKYYLSNIQDYCKLEQSLKKDTRIINHYFSIDSVKVISELKKLCDSNNCSDFNNDFHFMKKLIKINGLALEIASNELKNNINLIYIAIDNDKKSLQFTGKKLIEDQKDLFFYIVQDCKDELNNMSIDFIISIIQSNGLILQFVSDTLPAYREIVEIAIQNNGLALQFVNETLRADRKIVEMAIKSNGLALQFASDTLRANIDLIKIAIKNNPIIYIYLPDALKNDDDIIDSFIDETNNLQDEKLWNEFNKKISNNSILMLKFIKINYEWFDYIGTMLNNIIFYIKAIKENCNVLQFIDTLKNSIIIKYFVTLSNVNNLNTGLTLVINNLKNNNEIDNEQIIYFLNSDIDDNEKLYLMILLCSYNPNYYNTFYEFLSKEVKKNDDLLLIYDGYIPSPLRNNLNCKIGGRCYFNSTIQLLLCIKEIRNIILQIKNNNSNDILVKSIKSIFKNFLSKTCNNSICMENIGRYDALFRNFYNLSPNRSSNITNVDYAKSTDVSLDIRKYGGDPIHIIKYFFFKIPQINDLFLEILLDNLDQIKSFKFERKKYILIILHKNIRDNIIKNNDVYNQIIVFFKNNKYQIKSILQGYFHKISYVRTIGDNWFYCDDTNIKKIEYFDPIEKRDEPYIIIFENIE